MTVLPDLSTVNSLTPPTRKLIRRLVAEDAVSVTSSCQPSKVTPALFHVALDAIWVEALEMVPRVKVFWPRKLCVPVVTNPRFEVDAEGMLNVWVVPTEEIPKSVPLV